MSYIEQCPHSIRLIEKLKSLDTQNFLDFELINKAIYFAKESLRQNPPLLNYKGFHVINGL